MARPLVMYADFSRQEVHDIFSPDTVFTPQTGTWGLHGIVAIPGRTGDFAFFVTLGQRQGDHVFEEAITEDGALLWSTQPSQALADRQVQQFIRHDNRRNDIHLFFRTEGRAPYTYLGRLQYMLHGDQQERPVRIQWRLTAWPIPTDVLRRMKLTLAPPAVRRGQQLGQDYQLVIPEGRSSAGEPFSVDPEKVERGNRAHAETQNALAEFLTSQGLAPRLPAIGEPEYDVAWEANGCIYVAEVKSITDANEDKQLRLGLGQVLYYRHLLGELGKPVRAVLVPERQPRSSTWLALCESLDVTLAWPGGFDQSLG